MKQKLNNMRRKGVIDLSVAALQLMFIGLKLTNVIDWSWWWVLSPAWIILVTGAIATIVILATCWPRKNYIAQFYREGRDPTYLDKQGSVTAGRFFAQSFTSKRKAKAALAELMKTYSKLKGEVIPSK